MSVSPSSRPRQNGVAIACILSGGLIAAAIIDTHRPGAAFFSRAQPPIDQDPARQQFEAQMNEQLPQLPRIYPPYQSKLVADVYKGVKSVSVSYSAKEDTFKFDLTPTYNVISVPDGDICGPVASAAPMTMTASNDGYGHYTGSANLSCIGDDTRRVSVIIH